MPETPETSTQEEHSKGRAQGGGEGGGVDETALLAHQTNSQHQEGSTVERKSVKAGSSDADSNASESLDEGAAASSPKVQLLAKQVAELTEEARAKQIELQRAKDELDRQNRSAAARALELLRAKLKALSEGIGSNRSNVKNIRGSIQQLKESQLELFDEEKQRLTSVRRSELEQKVFDITGRRIEYDNLQSQRQRLDAEIQKRMAILDAIKEIESERADEEGGVDVDKASALLKKIDYFNKYLDPSKTISQELQQLQGQNFGQAISKFNSLDIVRAAKAEAHAERQRMHQDAMYELNLKRRHMERRLRQLEASKQRVSEQHAKGLRFLIHEELHHADRPDEKIGTAGSDGGSEPETWSSSDEADDTGISRRHGKRQAVSKALLTANEILKQAETNKRRGTTRVRQLRAGRIMDRSVVTELKSDISFMKPYDGSLGETSFGPGGPPKSWSWMRELVLQIYEGVMLRYFKSDKPLEMLLNEKNGVQQTEVVLGRKLDDHRTERAIYEVVDELIEATLVDLVRRLVNDVTYVSKFVEKRALGILTRFLPRQERIGGDPLASAQSSEFAETSIPSMVAELREQHAQQRQAAMLARRTLPDSAPYIEPANPLVIVQAQEMVDAAIKARKRREKGIFAGSLTADDDLDMNSREHARPVFDGVTLPISYRKMPVKVSDKARQAFQAAGGQEEFWKSLIYVPQKSGRRVRKKSTGSITCVEALQVPDTGNLASSMFVIGTSTAWVAVYRVVPGYAHADEIQLLAECKPHPGLKAGVLGAPSAAVRSLVLSADASQILSLHANGQLQIFHMFGSAGETAINVKPQGPGVAVNHRDPIPVKVLEPVLLLSHLEFMRPPPPQSSKQRQGIAGAGGRLSPRSRRRRQLKAGAPGHFIETACFFPGLTTAFAHPAVILGCQNGMVVKYNLPGHQDTFYLPTVATFEPPTFAGILESEGDLHLVSSGGAGATNAAGVKRNVAKLFGDPRRTVKREYFEGHEAKVICVGWTAAEAPTMISVDERGIVLEWLYDTDYFSGFGWFTPKRRFEFDLQHGPEGRVGGIMLRQAYVRPGANELHLVTEREDSMFINLVDLDSGLLWPSAVVATGAAKANAGITGGDHEDSGFRQLYGSNAPTCQLCYLPGIDACASDYYYLVANRSVRVFSLALGQLVRQVPLPLDFRRPLLAIVGQEHILVAEMGKDRMQMFQVHFSDEVMEWSGQALSYEGVPTSPVGDIPDIDIEDELEIASLEQFRLRRLLVEHRERSNNFDISEMHAHHEVQKIVHDIVNLAVDISFGKNKRRYAILQKMRGRLEGGPKQEAHAPLTRGLSFVT